MSSAEALPPELWLLIFDFVVASGVGLVHQGNHITFPDILNQLRDPWRYPPTVFPSLGRIRLVCRTFNALAAPSPYVFIKKKDTPIPSSARAAFIFPSGEAQVWLERLLAEPSKSQRIVILDLPGQEYRNSCVPFLFDLLCESSYSLPNVQSLTLGLHHYTSMAPATPNFWSRLNEAFPRLISLVLRGCLKTLSEPQPVVFERLEIMDLDMVSAETTVYFPALRHAAFCRMSAYSASRFTGWALLESLLIRETHPSSSFDWMLVPQLRLLGVLSSGLTEFALIPPQHPLQHLYIYVDTVPRNDHYQDPEREEKELLWMKQVLEKIHVVNQITLAYRPISNHLSGTIHGDFDEEDLAGMGFTRYYPRRAGSSKDHRVVLRRTNIQPQIGHLAGIENQGGEGNSHRKGFREGWDRFRRFALRKLLF